MCADTKDFNFIGESPPRPVFQLADLISDDRRHM